MLAMIALSLTFHVVIKLKDNDNLLRTKDL